jgi:LuxR family transcriptional regulator
MDSLLEPLKRVGIQYLTFMRNYKNGQQIYLSNIPGWVEDYYQYGLYRQFISTPPNDEQARTIIWPKDKPLMVFDLAKQRYNSDHGITLTKPRRNYCDYYFFSTSIDNPAIINFYVNYPDILEQFVAYFEDRAESLIKKAEQNLVILPRTTHLESAEKDPIATIDPKNILNIIQEMRLRKYRLKKEIYQGAKLSGQEIKCILNYLEFKTAEETACNMGVSKRTVESYFVNIKDKLGCHTKEDIARLLIEDGFDFLRVFCKKHRES